MDISTGPGLIEAIAETLNRQDVNTVIPSWVKMAESGFNQTLRTREMVKRSNIVATESFIPLPDDFREMKSVRIDDPTTGQPRRLFLSSEEAINDPRLRGAWSSEPKYFTIVGNEIELSPFKPGSNFKVEMTYFGKVDPLDVVTPGATNWLLQRAPQLYLYSALIFSAPHLVEDERIVLWTQLAADAVKSLNDEYEKGRNAGSSLREVRKSLGSTMDMPRPGL